jgi:hypothetical protein
MFPPNKILVCKERGRDYNSFLAILFREKGLWKSRVGGKEPTTTYLRFMSLKHAHWATI